jgi:hypothetical protein
MIIRFTSVYRLETSHFAVQTFLIVQNAFPHFAKITETEAADHQII